MTVFDIISSFPSIILALALVAVLGAGLGNVVLLVTVVFVPHFGRVARAQTMLVKSSPYLEAEQVLGAGQLAHPAAPRPAQHRRTHLRPRQHGRAGGHHHRGGLEFLGVGIRPPLASWGELLHDGYTYLSQSPWLAIVSGTALVVATLGFTLLGEQLRDILDPKLRPAR